MPTLDDILEQIGEFNRFQKETFFVLCLLSAAFTPIYVGVVFFGFTPEHRCFSPGVAELSQRCGWSLAEQLNHTVPEWGGHGAGFGSRCRRYDVDWNATGVSCTDPLSSLAANWSSAPLSPCRDGWVYDSPGTSMMTELNLVCEDFWKLDFFQSCVIAGFFIGSMIIGYMADVASLPLQSVLINSVSGVLVAFAPSYTWAVILWLIQGLVREGGWLTGYVLIYGTLPAEFVGLSFWRTVGLTYQLAFPVGLLILTAVADVLPHWRWLQLAITLPSFFFLLYHWCLPESPRWLITQKQNDKAMEVTKRMAKGNKKKLPLSFQVTALHLLSVCKARSKHLASTALCSLPRYTSAVFCQGLMHMGIASGNIYLDFLYSALVEHTATFILLLTVDCIGHRYPGAVANVMVGGACIGAALVPDNFYWLKMTTACLGRIGTTMCYEMVCLINPELHPTFLNLGVLVCSSMCDLGGIITPFIVYRLMELWHKLPLAIFAVIAFISSGLVLLLLETTGKTLPKTIEDAE
ncbi:S22A2 protein, partial [Chauna torquata]|nr:S22A2 protein [Chauna torquata]